jgi:hypothetical protein
MTSNNQPLQQVDETKENEKDDMSLEERVNWLRERVRYCNTVKCVVYVS